MEALLNKKQQLMVALINSAYRISIALISLLGAYLVTLLITYLMNDQRFLMSKRFCYIYLIFMFSGDLGRSAFLLFLTYKSQKKCRVDLLVSVLIFLSSLIIAIFMLFQYFSEGKDAFPWISVYIVFLIISYQALYPHNSLSLNLEKIGSETKLTLQGWYRDYVLNINTEYLVKSKSKYFLYMYCMLLILFILTLNFL